MKAKVNIAILALIKFCYTYFSFFTTFKCIYSWLLNRTKKSICRHSRIIHNDKKFKKRTLEIKRNKKNFTEQIVSIYF